MTAFQTPIQTGETTLFGGLPLDPDYAVPDAEKIYPVLTVRFELSLLGVFFEFLRYFTCVLQLNLATEDLREVRYKNKCFVHSTYVLAFFFLASAERSVREVPPDPEII